MERRKQGGGGKKPERLAILAKWEDAADKLFSVEKPAEGWPKPEGKKRGARRRTAKRRKAKG